MFRVKEEIMLENGEIEKTALERERRDKNDTTVKREGGRRGREKMAERIIELTAKEVTRLREIEVVRGERVER